MVSMEKSRGNPCKTLGECKYFLRYVDKKKDLWNMLRSLYIPERRSLLNEQHRKLALLFTTPKVQMLSPKRFRLIPYGQLQKLAENHAVRKKWNEGWNLLIGVNSRNKKKSNPSKWYKAFLCKMLSEIYMWRLMPLWANSWVIIEVLQNIP